MKQKWIKTFVLGAMLATVPTAAMAETVTIDFGDPVISVDAGQYLMREVAGVSEDGVILVPARDVAKAFQGTVIYDEATQQVRFTFPKGNWATIDIHTTDNRTSGNAAQENGFNTPAMILNDTLYVPADAMAQCIGGKVELIDYGRDEVYRLIYHVR